MTRSQTAILVSLGLSAAGLLLIAPHTALSIIGIPLSIFFLSIVSLRCAACFMTYWKERETVPHDTERKKEAQLPVYTVLVPLYREAHMLPSLKRSLLALDYPPDRLDIKLILEADDAETLRTVAHMDLPPHFEVITVPASEPRTKPKALNYAFHFARGEFVTIYDAEDHPTPDQLKKCVSLFQQNSDDLACIQAKLNFYNGSENWLTRQFTIEYTCLFDAFLPALERMGLPIPLGGTSNHFRLSALRESGAWDAFNLTEDADLGIRLYRNALRCAVISSTTYEEASCTFMNWLKQRTRWLKGWLQTYFVHMRRPGALWRDLGPWRFFGFQAVIGGLIVSAFAHPIFYAVLFGELATGGIPEDINALFSRPLTLLALVNIVLGYLSAMVLAILALRKRRLAFLNSQIIFLPFYWLMISLAAYRAAFQLATKPFLWEKTAHGISQKQAQAKCG